MVATDVESSLALANGTLESNLVGASLSAATVRATVSEVSENALVPPLVVVSAVAPFEPLVRSQARRVIAGSIRPFQFPTGLK